MKMVIDDTAIEAIVSMLMDLQDRENTSLALYEQQPAVGGHSKPAEFHLAGYLDQVHESLSGRTGSNKRGTGNQDCLQEVGKAHGERRVYDLLAPSLLQAGCTAKVPL